MAQNNCTPIYKRTVVSLTDPNYFCNKSWTLSYNVNTQSWISFHSYIPNFYIAENNFFYSGLNGCCDDIDAIAVNELPPTLTTTTTFCWTCRPATTSTTTTTLSCDLKGDALEIHCDILGDAVLIGTTTTTTTACVRPEGLNVYTMYYGYAEEDELIFSGSLAEACAASAYLSAIIDPNTFSLLTFLVYGESLTVGATLYYGNGTSCTPPNDGWYLTNESLYLGFVYHVVGGVIVSITYCASTTTSTTTIIS